MNKRTAFTLVELLVVIGIIAVLISILLPSLKQARESANTVQCMSNMRQIGMAILMYSNENGGSLPIHTTTSNVSFDDLLSRYDGRNLSEDEINKSGLDVGTRDSNRLYLCPSETIYNTEQFGYFMTGLKRTGAQRSYCFVRGPAAGGKARRGVYMPAKTDPELWTAKLSNRDIPVPVETIMMAEQRYQSTVGSPTGQTIDNASGQVNIAGTPPLHAKGTKWNYLMADMHVVTLAPEETFGTGSATNPRGMWSRTRDD